MLLLQYFGGSQDFLTDAFDDADIVALSSTSVTIRENNSGFVTVFTGSNIQAPSTPDGDPTGTITGFATVDGSGLPVLTASGVSWDISVFAQAIGDNQNNDPTGLNALLSAQDIRFDASAAREGVIFDFVGATSEVEIIGSAFEDEFGGGDGDDRITPNGAGFDGDVVFGTRGSDIIDFTGWPSSSWAALVYEFFSGVQVNVDAAANTATIRKSASETDTVIDVRAVMQADGLDIWGSMSGDIFNIFGVADSWMAIRPGAGNDTLTIGTEGTVRLDYSWGPGTAPFTGLVANLNTGVISNDGTGGQDSLTINAHNNRGIELRATDFDDSIIGSSFNDRFILRGGNDTLNGGAGFDSLRYNRNGFDGDVSVDLLGGTATGTWNGSAFNHQISGIEEVHGSAQNDTILGNGAGNEVDGKSGNDSINGRGGADTLEGADGDDSIDGGAGNDWIEGEQDNDLLRGQAGNDTLKGGDGNDVLNGNRGRDLLEGGNDNDRLLGLEDDDILRGEAGRDTLLGGAGSDDLFGNRGDDRLFGGNGGDAILGQEGDDSAFGGAGNDTVRGGSGDDNLAGGGQNDRVFGDGGNDTLFGNGGDDILNGGTGRDRIEAHAGNDTLRGHGGGDTLRGGLGDDRLEGGGQDDNLFGGDGNDLILGGAGRDFINGQAGNDTINGGTLADTLVFAVGMGADRVNGYQLGIDNLRLDADLWLAAEGDLTAAEVIDTFLSINAQGGLMDFGGGNSILFAGMTDGTGLADDVTII